MPALRGAFIKLEGGRVGSLADAIVFQFNPETVSRTPTLASPPRRPLGAGESDANDQPGEPSESISFSLRIDATDELSERDPDAQIYGILPALAALELLLYPRSALARGLSGEATAAPHRHPPEELSTALFFWGEQRILPVAVTSLSIFELEYDAALNPIRAEVSVNLDVLTPVAAGPPRHGGARGVPLHAGPQGHDGGAQQRQPAEPAHPHARQGADGMIFTGSRYEALARSPRLVRSADGRQHAALDIRFIPPTPAAYRHLVAGDDRLDLLAHRFYGDPERFWRIADANDAMDPEDLLEVGSELLIPPDVNP